MQWLFVVGRAAQKLKSVFGTLIVVAGLLLGASLPANATAIVKPPTLPGDTDALIFIVL